MYILSATTDDRNSYNPEKAEKFALQNSAEKHSISIEEANRLFRKEALLRK